MSGFRCPVHNAKAGGTVHSQHLLGLAADIPVYSDGHRFKLVKSLLDHGLKRIGIGASIIHADIGTITSPVIWTYYP